MIANHLLYDKKVNVVKHNLGENLVVDLVIVQELTIENRVDIIKEQVRTLVYEKEIALTAIEDSIRKAKEILAMSP